MCLPYLIIIKSCYFDEGWMVSLLDLFTWSRRTTRAKDHGLFILFTRSENPIIWKRRLTEIKKERTQTLKTNWRLLISCLDYLSCPFCPWYLNRNGKNKLYEDRTYCLVLYGGTYTYLRAQINTSYYRGHLTHRTHSSHKCSSRHFTFHRKYVFFE